jgi:isoquinoline 1-oxidoreductase alpha subunit
MSYMIRVNGVRKTVDVDGDTPLLWVLRDVVGLPGTKYGCGIGLCGACTVHLDGAAERACAIAIESVNGKAVTTIEAVGSTRVGRAVQKAWLDLDVVQCGYCQSGQIMSAVALLKAKPDPTDQEIREGMDANICRCGTYTRIHDAVKQAARTILIRKAV